jgi:hypothetical protein
MNGGLGMRAVLFNPPLIEGRLVKLGNGCGRETVVSVFLTDPGAPARTIRELVFNLFSGFFLLEKNEVICLI